MAEDHKKSESESESEKNTRMTRNHLDQVQIELNKAIEWIGILEKRLMRVERAYDALGRRLEGSERHVEDEGWFD